MTNENLEPEDDMVDDECFEECLKQLGEFRIEKGKVTWDAKAETDPCCAEIATSVQALNQFLLEGEVFIDADGTVFEKGERQ